MARIQAPVARKLASSLKRGSDSIRQFGMVTPGCTEEKEHPHKSILVKWFESLASQIRSRRKHFAMGWLVPTIESFLGNVETGTLTVTIPCFKESLRVTSKTKTIMC